jgi:hypothetical protein
MAIKCLGGYRSKRKKFDVTLNNSTWGNTWAYIEVQWSKDCDAISHAHAKAFTDAKKEKGTYGTFCCFALPAVNAAAVLLRHVAHNCRGDVRDNDTTFWVYKYIRTLLSLVPRKRFGILKQ